MEASGPKVLGANYKLVFDPLLQRCTRAFGYLEAHWFLRFALQHGCSFFDLARCHDVDNFQLHKVTTVKFAVDRHVEECEVAMFLGQFKSHADRPDVLWF